MFFFDKRMVLVKRETGASPVRTRHCNQGAAAKMSLGNWEDGSRDEL